ncbi:MAG: hypothetical protein KGN34_10100 [Sphingomonadales bacterium]|nr:hypothetical protein [Sphingomonadales bacterium]
MPNGPGSGPYPAVMETDPTLPNHVVYRPAMLPAAKLGVLVWGNGGCRDDGASARQHLLEIASHGYVVIAPGRILSGPTATGQRTVRQPGADGKLPPVATTAADVRAGLDWALRENHRKASRYFGRIAPSQTAVAGHSCGGLQALQVAGDRRIHAVLIHNSGVFADGSNPIQGITVDKALLKSLHTPVVYFLGGPGDVAFPNGSDDFRRIDHVPAVLVNLPVGHGGTFSRANGGAVAAAAVDWLEWQLRGDKAAGRTFTGANCRLCGAGTGWTIERKRID